MQQIIYVSSPESQEIYVWKLIRKFGTLKLIQVVHTLGKGQPIAIHPNKKFLYIGIRPDFGITTYHIDSSGLLTDCSTMQISSSITYIISNIQGTVLYCASYNFNSVSIIPLNNMGIPEGPVQIIGNLFGCHSVNIDQNNPELLWVPCLQEDCVRVFMINKSGTLTPWSISHISSVGTKSGPRHMVFDNSGFYAYVINELNSTVDVIKYNFFKKNVQIVQTLNIFPKNMSVAKCWAADIHITPNGRWLYCSDRAMNLISCLEIFCNKSIKNIKFINYQFTEIQPRGFTIDLTGEFLIVVGQISNNIAVYRIDPNNGNLTLLSCYQSGCGPMWVSTILI